MGTNYYLSINHCEHCQRAELLHIGKSSHGWKFLWDLATERQIDGGIKEFLEHRAEPIVDEYGRTVSREEFWNKVAEKKNGKSHIEESDDPTRYTVIDGREYLGGGNWS